MERTTSSAVRNELSFRWNDIHHPERYRVDGARTMVRDSLIGKGLNPTSAFLRDFPPVMRTWWDVVEDAQVAIKMMEEEKKNPEEFDRHLMTVSLRAYYVIFDHLHMAMDKLPHSWDTNAIRNGVPS